MAEEQHEKGKEYLEYFNGLLTITLRHLSYKKLYDAYKNESRVTFEKNGQKFSFDAKGVIDYNGETRDVWIESKGYSAGDSLLKSYKEFILRVYKAIESQKAYEDDIFIFVTNTPFGSSQKNLFRKEFIVSVLIKELGNVDAKTVLKINKISESIFGIIFTDSYVNLLIDSKSFNKNDSIWSTWKNREYKIIEWETFLDMCKILNPEIEDLNKVRENGIVKIPKI